MKSGEFLVLEILLTTVVKVDERIIVFITILHWIASICPQSPYFLLRFGDHLFIGCGDENGGKQWVLSIR